ncbi:hypothetical protein LZC95_19860 [Pendulispora brunnea]|uniref:Rhamnogalacturonase A/B/Epimerase-like pectate lyase domain-containing protein n=1 Tax=Pendulispora brunnea TaxID=2905690 RepID=A0ABZ2KPS9_9BACT
MNTNEAAAILPVGPNVSNVRRFGAIGDGVANDTLAVQAAIEAVPRAGGVVYFPPGMYRLTSPLRIARGSIRLCGAGRHLSTLRQSGFFGPLMLGGPVLEPLPTAPSLVNGPGAALDFRGSKFDHYLNLRDCPSLEVDGLSQFCAECFFKPSDVSTVGQLFGSYGRLFSTAPFTSAFSLFKVGDRIVAHVTVNGVMHSLLSPPGTLVMGKVYHVAVTFDGEGADTTLRLYVNDPGTGPNEPIASLTLSGKGVLTQSDYENVVVGFSFFGWPCTGGAYFNMCGGDLDSIRISHRAVYERTIKAPDAKLPFVSGQTLVVVNGDRVNDSFVVLATSSGPFYCALRRISMKSIITNVEVSDLGFSGGGLDFFLTPDGRYRNLYIASARYGMRLKNNCFFSAGHNIDMLITSGKGGEFGIENSDASGVNHWSQLKILAKLGFVSYSSSVSLVDANFQVWKDYAAVFSGAGGSNATIDIRNPIINDEGCTTPPKNAILAFDSVLGAHISGGLLQYIWSKAPLLSVTGPSHVGIVGTTLSPALDAEEVVHGHPDGAPKNISLLAARMVQPIRPVPVTKSGQMSINMLP